MTASAHSLSSLAEGFRTQMSPYSGDFAEYGVENGEFTAEQAAALQPTGEALVAALADFIDAAVAAEAFDQPLAFAEGLHETLERAQQFDALRTLLGG